MAEDPEDLGHVFKARELDLSKVPGPCSFYQTGTSHRREGRGFDHNHPPLQRETHGANLGEMVHFYSSDQFPLLFSPLSPVVLLPPTLVLDSSLY